MGIFERTLPTIYETSSSTEKRITNNKNNNPKIFFLSTIFSISRLCASIHRFGHRRISAVGGCPRIQQSCHFEPRNAGREILLYRIYVSFRFLPEPALSVNTKIPRFALRGVGPTLRPGSPTGWKRGRRLGMTEAKGSK